MKRDDNILEEDNMLISKWYSKTTDDTGEDVEKLSSSIELVGLVNKGVEALIDSLSYHLSSWNKFGVKFVKNVLQVVSLHWLLGIEKLQELLNELRCHVHFESLYLNGFMDNKL